MAYFFIGLYQGLKTVTNLCVKNVFKEEVRNNI